MQSKKALWNKKKLEIGLTLEIGNNIFLVILSIQLMVKKKLILPLNRVLPLYYYEIGWKQKYYSLNIYYTVNQVA